MVTAAARQSEKRSGDLAPEMPARRKVEALTAGDRRMLEQIGQQPNVDEVIYVEPY